MNHHSASTPVSCLRFRPCPRRPSERTSASRTAAAPNASVVSTSAMHPPAWKSGPATAKKSSAAPSRSGTIEETPRKSPRTPSSARTDGLAIFRGHSSLATSLSMISRAPPRAGPQHPSGHRRPDAWLRQNYARHPVAPTTHPDQGGLDLTPLAQPSAPGPKHFPCASGPPSPMSYTPCPPPRPILPRS